MSSRKHSQSLPGMVAKIERQIMAMKGGARVCLSISLSSQGLPSVRVELSPPYTNKHMGDQKGWCGYYLLNISSPLFGL